MVLYDVDTDPRLRMYVALVLISVFLASALPGAFNEEVALGFVKSLPLVGPFAVPYVEPYVEPFVSLGQRVTPFLKPFVIFGFLLWLFDIWLWRWFLIRKLSGIPYLGGTWTGDLSRSALNPNDEPQTGKVKCCIRQTWRHIDFVFEGLPMDVPALERQTRRIHSTRGNALTVGMFVKNADNVHVRYIYAAGTMSMLNPHNVSERAGEGTAVLYLLRESDKKYLQGTYYGDKMRGGNVYLEYEPDNRRLWGRAWDWLRK